MMKQEIKRNNRTPDESTRGLNIFVLIDALGWEIIKDCSFLKEELPVRQPLKTVLGYSCGAIPTILTGKLPSETGRWNLFYYDPRQSPFRWLRWCSFLPDRVLDNRYTRKAIKELGRRFLGMGPLFECGVSPRILPRFNYVEKENIYAAGGIPGAVTIFDLLEKKGVPHRIYSYHYLSDREILNKATIEIESSDARFFFVYLSEIDRFLHKQRNDSHAIAQKLAWYDEQLRRLFVAAVKRDPNATFTIVSDHGMTPVRAHFDMVQDINKLGLKTPEEYIAVYDSTMARFWFYSANARETILAQLERISCGRLLDDEELDRLGVLFPDRRYGEAIFLLDPGCLIAESNFNGTGWNPVGMHGYDPSDPQSDAVFLSNRIPQSSMKSVVDIFPRMAAAVESTPAGI